jgi:hypothetical protein
MTDNYANIVRDNLYRLYNNLPKDLASNLPGEQDGNRFVFNAFGERCVIEPKRIKLGKTEHSSVFGILISLYALHACSDICVPSPFKSFKEFPNSMPYVGAFTTHAEQVLVPHITKIKESVPRITESLKGGKPPLVLEAIFPLLFIHFRKSLCAIFFMKQTMIFQHRQNACIQITQINLCQ